MMTLQWTSVLILYTKEIRHFLRDRRTILSLLVAPVLLNSLLMTGLNFYFAKSRKSAQEKPLTLAVQQIDRLPGLRAALTEARFTLRDSHDARGETAAKKADAGIAVSTTAENTPAVTIYGDMTGMDGMVLKTRLAQPVQKLKTEKLREALAALGVTEAVLSPFSQKTVDVAPPAKSSGFFIGNVLPILLLQFLFVGCIYPAIDLTAGEKERRTIEMTLIAPVRREELVISKLLAVLTSGMAAMLISASTLLLTVRFMSATSGSSASSSGPWSFLQALSIHPGTILLVGFSILPVAVMLASVVLALAASSKSSQEASSYVTPLLLVTIVLTMASILPGINLDWGTALIPISNFSLAVRGLLTGEWSVGMLGLAMAANLMYAAGAVAFAVRAFYRESILARA